MKRRTSTAWLSTLVLLTCIGCSAGATRAPARGTTSNRSGRFGPPASVSPGVRLRNDVVVVGGGSAAVRGVSRDGLTWTLDPSAPHLSELAVGKVLLLTARVTGRVAQLSPGADGTRVTLVPVQLGDVVADGRLRLQQPLDLRAGAVQSYDGGSGVLSPTATVSPSAEQSSWRGATWRVNGAAYRTDGGDPELPADETKVGVGGFTLSLDTSTEGDSQLLSLTIEHGEDLSFDGVVTARLTHPQVSADLDIVDGQPADGSSLVISGLDRLTASLGSGSLGGLRSNVHQKVEVPIQVCLDVPAEGIPLVLCGELKFLLETAFSARDSSLRTHGAVNVDGPLALTWEHGSASLTVPTVTEQQQPLASLEGASVGVTGLVFAVAVKFQLGVGVEAARAGPYLSTTLTYALTDGSSVGITHCRQTHTYVDLSGGIGLSLDPAKVAWLTALGLGDLLPSYDASRGVTSARLLARSGYAPQVPVCRTS